MKILLVEDNEGDIFLTLEALKDSTISYGIHIVKDGEQALQFLRKEGQFKEAETPNLIFLDLNLPKIDGMEVLTEIKRDLILKTIPVVMLSTSNSEKDVTASYRNHAYCYITKPVDVQILEEVVQKIKNA
ncbi:MAG: response regulator [Ginsengibacter sp.]